MSFYTSSDTSSCTSYALRGKKTKVGMMPLGQPFFWSRRIFLLSALLGSWHNTSRARCQSQLSLIVTWTVWLRCCAVKSTRTGHVADTTRATCWRSAGCKGALEGIVEILVSQIRERIDEMVTLPMEQGEDDGKKAYDINSFDQTEDERKVLVQQIAGYKDAIKDCECQLSTTHARIEAVLDERGEGD